MHTNTHAEVFRAEKPAQGTSQLHREGEGRRCGTKDDSHKIHGGGRRGISGIGGDNRMSLLFTAIASIAAAILIGGVGIGLLARYMNGKKVLPF
jgi:hypothetical protein